MTNRKGTNSKQQQKGDNPQQKGDRGLSEILCSGISFGNNPMADLSDTLIHILHHLAGRLIAHQPPDFCTFHIRAKE